MTTNSTRMAEWKLTTNLKAICKRHVVDAVAAVLHKTEDPKSPLTVSIHFNALVEETSPELTRIRRLIQLIAPHRTQQRRNRFKRAKKIVSQEAHLPTASLAIALETLQPHHFEEHKCFPPTTALENPVANFEAQSVRIRCSHTPLYLRGHYCKYSREVSQTIWILPNGQRREDRSVEEEIRGPCLELLGAIEAKFHASGREDADVRMLGDGRPFMMELVNPHRTDDVKADTLQLLEQTVNAKSDVVQVSRLSIHNNRAGVQDVLLGAADKQKIYRCVVYSKCKVTPQKLEQVLARDTPLEVKQNTPIRVLHRRSPLIRDKVIYKIVPKWISPHFFLLDLTTSAGTYVKEFVHGDRGRTIPSVCQMLDCEATIIQLDVIDLIL
jgi:tRNA U54 and U55 pseudouridine synthase Pus10